MAQELDILQIIWSAIAKNIPIQCTYAVVESIDKDKHLCDCILLENDSPLPEVQLTAVAEQQDSHIIVYPKIGSTVMVAIINNNKLDAYVAKVSEWDDIELVNGQTEVEIDKDKIVAKIDTAELKLTKDEFSFKKGNTEIKAAAKILIKVGSKSVGGVLDAFFQKLATAQVLTPAGPGSFKPDTIADIQTAKADLAIILQS